MLVDYSARPRYEHVDFPKGANEHTRQAFGFIQELDEVHRALDAAANAMARISGNNMFYAEPLMLYAYAIERLLKMSLYLRVWAKTGEKPNGEKIRKMGHRICKLHDAVFSSCWEGPRTEANGLCESLVNEDKDWLTSDPLALHFIDVLDAYVNQSRYSHLSEALGIEGSEKDPMDLATDLEKEVADAWGIKANVLAEDFDIDAYYSEVSQQIVGIARRYVRAVMRLWWYRYMGSAGSQYSAGVLADHFRLRDDELADHPAFRS